MPLYKTASEHGVKIIGVEGRNLQADKIFPGEYDQAREEYMADRIHQVACKGYNLIVHIGAAHVGSLRKLLTSFPEIDTPESSRWDRVLSEVAGSNFVGEDAENFDEMIFASYAHDYPSREIDLMGNYTLGV